MTNVIAITLLALASSAAQSGLAGQRTGVDQNNHPVTLELVVKGEERARNERSLEAGIRLRLA